MAKVFFYLEQEAMRPRYEIHSLGMPDVVQPVPAGRAGQQDRAARALFAATEMVSSNQFETVFGRAVPATKYAEFHARYQQRYGEQVHRLAGIFARSCGTDLQACASSDALRPPRGMPGAPVCG